jgi:hypothetical protein
MRNYDPTNSYAKSTARPVSNATTTEQRRRPPVRRLLAVGRSRWTMGAALLGAAIVLAACGTSSTSATSPSAAAAGGSAAGGLGSVGGGSNARSGPAAGGASGTVASVSSTGFTMSTSAGQKVTVVEAPSTTYETDTSSTSASAIAAGEGVLVLGTTSGTTITATQVMVQATPGAAASSAAGVVPFQQGAATTSKQVGQIPANYSQGSGTIVSGTTANKAIEAALAAYPGGVVDRVVEVSTGVYEVHYIGVNWPHHIFVNADFTVVGAN